MYFRNDESPDFGWIIGQKNWQFGHFVYNFTQKLQCLGWWFRQLMVVKDFHFREIGVESATFTLHHWSLDCQKFHSNYFLVPNNCIRNSIQHTADEFNHFLDKCQFALANNDWNFCEGPKICLSHCFRSFGESVWAFARIGDFLSSFRTKFDSMLATESDPSTSS